MLDSPPLFCIATPYHKGGKAGRVRVYLCSWAHTPGPSPNSCSYKETHNAVKFTVNSKSSIMAVLTFILAFLLIGVVSLYFYMRRHHGYLETTGLPVVPAFMCFGSPPYAFHRIHYHEWFTEKFRQLGRTFARYQGVTPAIITIDPEFIKEITVKQFDNFSHVITTEMPTPPEQCTLDVSR